MSSIDAAESRLLSDNISSCVTLTARRTGISEDALPANRSFEPVTFNYEPRIYRRDAVTSSKHYSRRHLIFLQYFDLNKSHYVIALLLDSRYTRLSLLVDYARIDRSANILHIKRNVKTYLDVLIE